MSIGKRPHKDIARLRPFLSEDFSDFVLRGTMLLHAPIEDILWGFHFDARPGHGKTRWLHAFAMPLLVPKDYVSLEFGDRVPNGRSRGHDAYPIDLETSVDLIETNQVMQTEGLEVLSNWNSVSAFRLSLEKPSLTAFMHNRQAAAVLAARQGEYAEAARIIRECESYVGAFESRDIDAMRRFKPSANENSELRAWEKDVLVRTSPLLEPCIRCDHEAAQALLDEWRSYTISKLGIEDLCV